MAAAARQPTLFSPHIKPPFSPTPPSHPSLPPLLKCGSKAGKLQWLRSCRPRSPSAAAACTDKLCRRSLSVPKEGEGVPSDLSSPYFPAFLGSKEWACLSYRITVLCLDTEVKLASLFAKTKNVNWNIMIVFCFAKGTKSKTHVIAAIHIYLKDSCHQEEHQQRAVYDRNRDQ